ncbi:MAG: metallophosphoesterase [Rhodospirillaceae bacterium]|nr:metallophosphoesterase [Rhodospirillaceae bacterium]
MSALENPGGDRPFQLWAQGCAHVFHDKTCGRESLGDALRQSERGGPAGDDAGAPPFDWDICINVGDYSSAFGPPNDEEGAEIVRQFGALRDHRREQVYSVCGNHDRDPFSEPEGSWFRKWIDPMGENTATSGVERSRYPYPVHGTWDRYWFEVGNIRFLMMSDVNERAQTLGRGPLGGNPGGVVTAETFDWWADMVERSRGERIVVTVHHYVLKETTVASGEWEGMKKGPDGAWQMDYHGYYAEGTPNGASYLYWVGGAADSGRFERYLEDNPGAVALWFGGHTHTNPDDQHGGKSHIETRYGGTTFVNAAALTRHFVADHAMPHSRVLTFAPGSREVRIRCYMHTSEHRPAGWYDGRERRITLGRPFTWEG